MITTSADRKHESADYPNQPTCLVPYLNELVAPLHDTCGTFGQISIRIKISIQCDYRDEFVL